MSQDDFQGFSDQQLEQAIQGNISGLEQEIGSWISSKESPQGNNSGLGGGIYLPPQPVVGSSSGLGGGID